MSAGRLARRAARAARFPAADRATRPATRRRYPDAGLTRPAVVPRSGGQVLPAHGRSAMLGASSRPASVAPASPGALLVVDGGREIRRLTAIILADAESAAPRRPA